MSSFVEEQLQEVIDSLKAGVADFTLKINSAKLDVAPSTRNNDSFLRFETRVTDINRKIRGVENSRIERKARKWRLHPEVYSREVLADLEQSRGVKPELEQLVRDLDSFKVRALRHESLNRMGLSSLEMLKISSVSIHKSSKVP